MLRFCIAIMLFCPFLLLINCTKHQSETDSTVVQRNSSGGITIRSYYTTKNHKNLRHGNSLDLHGNGVLSRKGQYSNGKKTGTWTSYSSKGLLSSRATYIDDAKHGKYTRWSHGGVVIEEGTYERGEKVGVWRGWWEPRSMDDELTLQYESNFYDEANISTYSYKSWHRNGALAGQGESRNSEPIGIWREWWEPENSDDEPILKSETDYGDGTNPGSYSYKSWHENGVLAEQGQHRNYERVGIWREWWEPENSDDEPILKSEKDYGDGTNPGSYSYKSWHENGVLAEQWKIRNNKRVGIWKKFNQEGTLVQEHNYDNENSK